MWLHKKNAISQKNESKALTAIRRLFGLVIGIVRFEIAAHRWRCEALRTTNRDSRHLSSLENLSISVNSQKCQKPQPPLLPKKVLQYTSHLYCNTPPICTAVLLVPLRSEEREYCQYSSHLYRSTPPICIAILLGKSWWLWSPECSPISPLTTSTLAIKGNVLEKCL